LSREETARAQAILDQAGLAGRISAAECLKILRLRDAVAPPSAPIPTLTVSARMEKTRKWIETTARRIDVGRGFEFGSTNRRLMREFGVSRDAMNEEQLAQVVAYLNRHFPEATA
jgi:hypothetical protein